MCDAFDVIIVGGGIIGRLTAWLCGKFGKSTLLLEKNSITKSEGSSKGISRMFGESFVRDVYFQLARQSRDLWLELENETGQKLLYLTGGLDISTSSNARDEIKKLASILRRRNSRFEVFDGIGLHCRYPQWRPHSNTCALYSPDSGILRSDYCMQAAITAALKLGVTVKDESRVTSITSNSGKVLVKLLSGRTYCARRLVIAAGPWMLNILNRLTVKLPLRVSQEQVVYFAPCSDTEIFEPDNFPVWEWEGEEFVYGFPIFEKKGVKICFHGDGRYLKNLAEFKHTPSSKVTKRLLLFLKKHLPDAAGELVGATTCLYTNTPDQDFVIDTVPDIPQIGYFTGDSGHAFHCAPAVSKTLVELVFGRKTSIDISSFSAKRFSG